MKAILKVAIVGTSYEMTDNEARQVRQEINLILNDYKPITTTIISGGAKGVDSLAQEIGLQRGFAVKPILPIGFGRKANLARNVEIAEECDKLFCISIPVHYKKCYHHDTLQNHEKTAGCYTMKKALEFNKECKLIIIPETKECLSGEHLWENDEMFESGAVMMITNDNPDKRLGQEMRQQCSKCEKVRYIQK